MNAIVMDNLTKCFANRTAVNHLSLTIGQGEIFALLGQNGAGKTTTIRMLCGLLRPSEGDAILMGSQLSYTPIFFSERRCPVLEDQDPQN